MATRLNHGGEFDRQYEHEQGALLDLLLEGIESYAVSLRTPVVCDELSKRVALASIRKCDGEDCSACPRAIDVLTTKQR